MDDFREGAAMDTMVKTGLVEEEAEEVAAIMLFEAAGIPRKPSSLRRINTALHGVIGSLFKDKEFTAKACQVKVLHTFGHLNAKRIMLLGLGQKKKFTIDVLRKASAAAVSRASDLKVKHFTVEVPEEIIKLPADKLAEALLVGAQLSNYKFEKYRRSQEKNHSVIRLTMLCTKRSVERVKKGLERSKIIAKAVGLARDIANESGDPATPKNIGVWSKRISKKNGVKCQVFDEDSLKKQEMGAILSVGKGSENPPRLVVMEYGSNRNPTVALIGKGITFDTGGISLKPGKDMEMMKYDKSGAAAIIATVQAAAQLKLPVHVVGIVPLAENVPSGKSYKPGDIIHTMSGKTVEVINTDAEGRLILSDALTYAGQYKPRYVIDIATLTGACVVALGSQAAGLLGNDAVLMRNLKKSGEDQGERLWQLPLFNEYSEQMKSDIADLRNTGGREGGTITAAAFLSNFVEGERWAHIDIAGTAWSNENKGYLRKGATGFGVRLLLDFLGGIRK
jgi:leucyl aminopeptidase